MAKLQLLAGTTSKTIKIFVQNSSVTTGAGLTGLAFNTSGLTAYYIREGANATTAISLVTATLGTWTSSGFIVVDGTNMPGVYEIGLPNAAIASGAKSVVVYLQGATNMAPCVLEIELTAVDNQDGVHYGMSALPNTAVTTNASLITSGTGTDQLSVTSGRIDMGKLLGTAISTPATAGIMDINVKNINNAAAATPGASGGMIINGTNAGALTEGYAALNAAPTINQLLYEVRSLLAQVSISGTTLTTQKIDGSTTAETFTLNSSTAPTSITRAS